MDQKEPIKERRKYVRLKANVEVKYTVIGKPGEIEVFSKDISAGGICILIKEKLPTDTPLQIEIIIPDINEPIRALGRVVWQQQVQGQESDIGFNTGIEFTGISDFDHFNLNRYVMEHI